MLPFAIPDWVPSWVPFVVLVPAVLWLLAFLLVPFSVLGLKGRLDAVESRLDEVQGELRALSLRLPELRAATYAADAELRGPEPRTRPAAEPDRSRPPIPPPDPGWVPDRPRDRTEPRFGYTR